MAIKPRRFRILGVALAALLPACGGGGHGSGGTSGGGTANPAFPVTMTEPSAGQTFTAPATISMSAVPTDPSSIATVEFIQGVRPAPPFPNTPIWSGGVVVATLTQPPFQATWTDAPPGIQTIVARVTDKLGAQTFSNSVTFSVLGPGESPGGWTPIARVPAAGGICFVDANRGWIAGNTQILHTVDGGGTWVAQWIAPLPQGPGPVPQQVSAVQFIDADRGWAVGTQDTVLRTRDGGATWIPSPTGTGVDLGALSFVDANTGWVVGGPGAKVFATKDGGVTWAPLPTIPASQLFITAVQFVDRESGWIIFPTQPLEPMLILHTRDGGLTWSEQLRSDPGDSFIAMDFVSATTGWVSRNHGHGVNRGILFTNDGGATWTEQTPPGEESALALDFIFPTLGWGVSSGSTIIQTEDGGQTWVAQPTPGGSPSQGFGKVQFLDANRGWALLVDGLLLKTTTGGKAP